MKRARPGGGPGRAAAFSSGDAFSDSRVHHERQALPPIERHEPHLPDDKLFEAEITGPALLRGRTQGPGRLGDLMRAGRRP